MRTLMLLICCLNLSLAQAQIKGNGKITSQDIPGSNLTNIVVDLYAKVEIDCGATSYFTITADENLLPLIDTEILDGKLTLRQKEWIKPSRDIVIKIGAPALKRVEQSVHETTIVRNLNTEDFQAMAILGGIDLSGKVTNLSVSGELGQIKARSVESTNVQVNLWGWGSIDLGAPQKIKGIVKEGGQVYYEGTPKIDVKKSKDGTIVNRDEVPEPINPEARFIDLKIKNNSLNRINAYVVGPKPDGRKFSYGFPLNPGQVRKKNWSIGSKVYRVSKLGVKKLLLEITAEDEGQMVTLYND